jgi:hypothetical protein
VAAVANSDHFTVHGHVAALFFRRQVGWSASRLGLTLPSGMW